MRILLIDDYPVHLRTLSEILSEEQNEIVVAKSGELGLELAIKQDIDLILLDLMMPGMSGFDVLVKLKAAPETREIPVIIITGSDSTDDEIKGFDLGAVDYIKKPYVTQIVKQRVSIHLKMLAQMRLIQSFSLTDGLTGLNNRRSYDTAIKMEWTRAQRDKKPLAMLMLDIDNFKAFNDSYMHLNGDRCLQMVARIMRENIRRGGDFSYRWGGEEFAVLLPNTDAEGARLVAENIRTAIKKTPVMLEEGGEAYITVSIGVGVIIPRQDANDTDLRKFCGDVDRALFHAKSSGKDRVEGA